MKVRKNSHNHIAYILLYKNQETECTNTQSQRTRLEPLYKHIIMITDYQYTHTTYSQLTKENLRTYDCECGAKDRTKYHSQYKRHVISLTPDVLAKIFEAEIEQDGIDMKDFEDMSDELFTDTILDIFRVKCTSCNTTHAILPGDVVPFRRYSLLRNH